MLASAHGKGSSRTDHTMADTVTLGDISPVPSRIVLGRTSRGKRTLVSVVIH